MKKNAMILGKLDTSSLLKAKESFTRALKEAKSELERDGVIQRFEFTYELVWKTLKRILNLKGLDVNSPRDVFRASAKEGFIDDPKIWFDFIKKRNQVLSENYEELKAEVLSVLPKFEEELCKFVNEVCLLDL